MDIYRPAQLWKLYRLPVGRLVFALEIMRARAQERGVSTVANHARFAAEQCRLLMSMHLRRDAGRRSMYSPEARALDTKVDNRAVGIDMYLSSQERVYTGEERGEAATRLRWALFPRGVGAVVNLPYAQEYAQVDAVLERSREDDLSEDIALMPELPSLLDGLAEANRDYGEALWESEQVPSRHEVDQLRGRCDDLMAETMAAIVTHYALYAPDDPDGRSYLLEPLLTQNEAVRIARRRRRVPPDIDPDTGDEIPGGEAPLDPGGDAGGGESGEVEPVSAAATGSGA
ncbi:hypothetical protein [Haliangium sp.]|uniref:hypothetical protein n=1 Tax=Haliangium sp. TaxID=2663208 RepID=UPI003D1413C8